MITTKKSINYGVKSMTAKAQSWSQVCKQISGIGGYVEIADGVKVRPLELMQSLGVHVPKNSYSPKDIFTAWSERLKKDGKVCIVGSVPYTIVVEGKAYTLHTKREGEYYRVSQSTLVPLVSASDKVSKTDKVVNAANVLRGLQQSVFVTATLERIEKSAKKCADMTEGYVNISTDKKTENFVPVCKGANGEWVVKVINAEKKSTKKGAKKSA